MVPIALNTGSSPILRAEPSTPPGALKPPSEGPPTRLTSNPANAVHALTQRLQIPQSQAPRALAAADALASASSDSMSELIKDLAEGQFAGADVDALLQALVSRSVPLERGIVGPTGASSTISFSVFGPIFGLWGLIAGIQIILRAGDAKGYLQKLKQQATHREQALEALRQDVKDTPHLAENVKDLEQRLAALRAFIVGVERSRAEQHFNQAFPGTLQVGASSLILALAVDSLPRAGDHAMLFGHAATMSLATTAASGLGIYAAASFLKSGWDFIQACRTRRMTHTEGEGDDATRFIDEFNKSVGMHRLFYGLNTASWGVYVGGAAALAAISAGVGLSHGTAVAAVVIGAMCAVMWDAAWGKKCAPHNALTPHVDRNYLINEPRLQEAWVLLDKERTMLGKLQAQMVSAMPAHHAEGGKRNRWKQLDKKKRFRIWQWVPGMLGGGRKRLAKWAVKDERVVAPLMRDYLRDYTQYEIAYLEKKAQAKLDSLKARGDELAQVAHKGLQETWQKDLDNLDGETKRLQAMRSLVDELGGLNINAMPSDPESRARWNRARLTFLSAHGLLGHFITRKQLQKDRNLRGKDDRWFQFDERKQRLRRNQINNIRLTPKGYQELSRDGAFNRAMEREFLATVVNRDLNAYEIRAVFKKVGVLHRGHERHKRQESSRRARALRFFSGCLGEPPTKQASAPPPLGETVVAGTPQN